MQFFLDTANIEEIEEFLDTGLIDGVTTNPSLILKSGRKHEEVIAEIAALVDGDVSAEVTENDVAGMISQGRDLAGIASNIVVKVPMTWDGIKACSELAEDGIGVNVTLCFTATQALLAAKAGARYVSPFVGRHDDISFDGMELIDDICEIYANYPEYDTEVLVASVRHPVHVLQSAKMGADICTLPPKVLKSLIKHPLTDAGLAAFMQDWEKTQEQFG